MDAQRLHRLAQLQGFSTFVAPAQTADRLNEH
jgi:hypothetical protein